MQSDSETLIRDPALAMIAMADNPDVTVDGRFTSDGLSVSMYTEDGIVLDEAWFTYEEMEELQGDEESNFTFEIEL